MNADTPVSEPKESWSVVVVYEDTFARDRAMQLCDHLVREFWSNIEFDFHWWRFSYLGERLLAEEAAAHALTARVIIFATTPQAGLPLVVQDWVESWVDKRGEREGVVIGLATTGGAYPCGSAADVYVRSVARRAGMDYLTEALPVAPGTLPNSLDTYRQRAAQKTSVLDEILSHAPPPAFSG